PLFPRLALFKEGRRPPGRALEAGVAPPAPAPAGGHPPLAGGDQVREEPALVVFHLGARRHPDHQVFPVSPVLVGALAVLAPLRDEVRPPGEVDERGKALVHLEDHVAALAPVAPVGTAGRHVLLPPEAGAAVAAVSRLDEDTGLVDQDPVLTSGRPCAKRPGAWPRVAASSFESPALSRLREDRLGVDADALSILAQALKADVAVDLGKQRVVLAQADVAPGMELGPPLADQDAPRRHQLAGVGLDAQTLGVAIPAVAGAAHPLLVREELQVHADQLATPSTAT